MSRPPPPPRTGRALRLGDDVNTDELHPSVFYSLDDARVRQGWLGAVPGRSGGGDAGPLVILAGRNFGCGSSRETGARVFTLVGVQAVVAVSFARIFQRNLINLGLPALSCPALATAPVADGAMAEVDLALGILRVEGAALDLEPLDPLHAEILACGGLLPYLEGGA